MDITADEAFSQIGGIEAPERQRAVEWLKEILSAVDSLPSKEMNRLAKEQGFKEVTIERARKEIGVKCFPMFDDDGNKSWHWKLPKKEGDKPKLPSLSDALKRLNKMKEMTSLV